MGTLLQKAMSGRVDRTCQSRSGKMSPVTGGTGITRRTGIAMTNRQLGFLILYFVLLVFALAAFAKAASH